MQHIFFLLLLVFFSGCTEMDNERSLEKTDWNAQFYYYSNFYHFGTNGQGYSDDGQTAWSCPIDLKAKQIPENKILYAGREKFRYELKKDTLTLDYLNPDRESRVFVYRKEYRNWMSLHSYTYGFEVLEPGERKEFFDEPAKLIK